MKIEWIIMAISVALTYSTAPLLLQYALRKFPHPAILVTFSSSFSSIAFILVALFFITFRAKNSIIIRRTLLNPYNYLKMIGLGLFHVAAPSFLFLYAIKWVPPIVPGAFMALVPFWTALFDRFPCVQKTSAITTVLRSLVILIGFIGVSATVTPTIYEMITYNCDCNSSVLSPAILTCIKSSYTEACGKDPLFYFMALGFCFLGSLSWSVSAVLWKRYGKMIHYTVGGALMQVIGTITGISLWAGLNGLSGFPLEISTTTNDILALIGFIYAGVLLAFLAALARYALYRQIGPINTDGLLVLIPAVTAVEEYFILRERQWATWSFIVTLVGAGLIIIAGLLGNSLLHDAITQGLDSSRSYRRKGIYEEGDRDQSNSTDIGGAHDNPYVAVSDQDSNDIKYKGKNKIDLPNRPKGDASSSTDQNIAMEQLRSLDDKLQQEMANINIESSKTSEPSNSQKADEQLDEQSADAFVLALQKSMENASTSSDSSGPTYGYKKTSLPSSQISPSMSDMIRSPSNESVYSLLNVSHKPNPYKNLIANSRTRADAPISTFDPKKTYVDRPSLSGASSIQQTTKPNPYQRK